MSRGLFLLRVWGSDTWDAKPSRVHELGTARWLSQPACVVRPASSFPARHTKRPELSELFLKQSFYWIPSPQIKSGPGSATPGISRKELPAPSEIYKKHWHRDLRAISVLLKCKPSPGQGTVSPGPQKGHTGGHILTGYRSGQCIPLPVSTALQRADTPQHNTHDRMLILHGNTKFGICGLTVCLSNWRWQGRCIRFCIIFPSVSKGFTRKCCEWRSRIHTYLRKEEPRVKLARPRLLEAPGM